MSRAEVAPQRVRVGLGYDVHRLVPGRRLVLGGVEVPHDRGLEGHSDADVLLHALCDALLGAAGLGDLGDHFPPGDRRWKDADSLDLLRLVMEKIKEAGFDLVNCDLTLIAEAPRIAPHRLAMRERIAAVTGLSVTEVGVKATTNESLGAVGRQEGMAAMAVALLESRQP